MTTGPMRILVVDDEPSIRNLLRLNLEGNGFAVAQAESGAQGLQLAAEFHPHLTILDLGLPDINGIEVLKRLRVWTTIPIIILTVSDDEETKVALLNAGADDYVTKPFSIPELLARVRVALRHHGDVEATPIFVSDGLEVDVNKKQVKVGQAEVKLTSTEYQLLSLLVKNHGKVVPQSQLLAAIWGPHSLDQSHYLRIFIAQLRKKLELDSASPKHILTEPGVGYKIV
ncbi:MAG: response regulator [Bdellovibrionales bacterium]